MSEHLGLPGGYYPFLFGARSFPRNKSYAAVRALSSPNGRLFDGMGLVPDIDLIGKGLIELNPTESD
jgi:hypothetical protein